MRGVSPDTTHSGQGASVAPQQGFLARTYSRIEQNSPIPPNGPFNVRLDAERAIDPSPVPFSPVYHQVFSAMDQGGSLAALFPQGSQFVRSFSFSPLSRLDETI